MSSNTYGAKSSDKSCSMSSNTKGAMPSDKSDGVSSDKIDNIDAMPSEERIARKLESGCAES